MTHAAFVPAARRVAEVALANGIPTVTVHPHLCSRDRLGEQRRALAALSRLQEEFGALFCLECFDEPDRCLRPEELAQLGLPVIVDAAHMCAFDLGPFLSANKQRVRNVHSSFAISAGAGVIVAGITGPPEMAFLQDVGGDWDGRVFFEHESDVLERVPDAIQAATRELAGAHRAAPRSGTTLLPARLAMLFVRSTPDEAMNEYMQAQAALTELERCNPQEATDFLMIGQIKFLAGRVGLRHAVADRDDLRRDFSAALSALVTARRMDPNLSFMVRREIKSARFYLKNVDRLAA